MIRHLSSRGITRRQTLKFIGAIGGTAVASQSFPFVTDARAQIVDFPAPPKAGLVPPGSNLATAYMNQLQTIIDDPVFPDSLYALTCAEMSDLPFDGKSLKSNQYTDDAPQGSLKTAPVGPTLEFFRGELSGVYLQNFMTDCGPDAMLSGDSSYYTPHGFTATNLHTHGLHVSPSQPSDDVLIQVNAKGTHAHAMTGMTTFDASYPYYYDLRGDHPVGTFWYHPHKHGSVSAQMATGMAGALLIRNGTDIPDFEDLLASECNITRDDEVVMVLQTIDYYPAKGGASGEVTYDPALYYGVPGQDQNDSCVDASATQTSVMCINGVPSPTLSIRPGEIKRLRLINATVGTVFVPRFSASEGEFVKPTGEAPELFAIATDGIALPKPQPFWDIFIHDDAPYYPIDYDATAGTAAYLMVAELITIAPGQRVDLLVKAPASEGTFYLFGVDGNNAPTVVTTGNDYDGSSILYRELMMTLSVTGTKRDDADAQKLPTLKLFKNTMINRPPEGWSLKSKELPAIDYHLKFQSNPSIDPGQKNKDG
ncbi:MAG: multicopper oxidase domain-containing protein, partial [Thalassobaculaceae bacterium]|nr:multicopper oxidase domain-containing protein [Thalassobaculaceae bacterium]